MNKRMREPFHTLMWKASIGYNDSWSQIDPEVLEKFAELIVQECIDIIAPYTVRMRRPGEEYLHPILEIKQNFGVDERTK